jgi:diadenylate cyclase
MLVNPGELIRSTEPYQMIIELAVIWWGVYLAFSVVRGTRGAAVIKWLAILLVLITLLVRVIAQSTDAFARLSFLYDRVLGLLAMALIVIFQPELRQAMVRLSQAKPFRFTATSAMRKVIEEVTEAVNFLSKNQFGSLIAIERGTSIGIGGALEGGQALDAEVSARLLEAIFWPNSPLHDLGVVIRKERVVAAGVQFPLAEEGSLPARTGSRHRAAAGLTLESDCVVVIVSEETGAVSLAEHGQIDFNIPREKLAEELERRLLGESGRREGEPSEAAQESGSKVGSGTAARMEAGARLG